MFEKLQTGEKIHDYARMIDKKFWAYSPTQFTYLITLITQITAVPLKFIHPVYCTEALHTLIVPGIQP